MPIKRQQLLEELRDLVSSYLGKEILQGNDDELLGDEVGLRGSDSIQFIQEVEDAYSVSLSNLLAVRIKQKEKSLIERIFGLRQREYSDFTLNELTDYILAQK